jgi:glycosyltransferase involved in cell wall biosynthesis
MMKLLIISYYWPPLGGPGAIRPVKFAKYLPRFGFEPVVITRKAIAYHSLDESLGQETEHLRTIRTESLDPARIFYFAGMRRYRPRPWHIPVKKALNFPDSKFPWIPFVYGAGIKVDFDAIFVTAPPFSSFIAGYLLAKKTGKPLILDFRDAWLEFPFLSYDTRAEKKFVSYWEEKVCRSAALIIVVDENIRDTLTVKYSGQRHKIHVIPNGYDPDDFAAAALPGTFTISYLGTIRKERNPENFLKSIDELLREKKLSSAGIQIKFIGHIEKHYLDLINKYGFAKCLGHLPYRKALREFSSAHVSLMITTGDEYFFPSRQNEYLAAGLPIIVCGKSQGIHRLESAFSLGYPGWIFDYDDRTGLEQKIMDLYGRFKNREITRHETPFKEYTRQILTGKLCDLIRTAGRQNNTTVHAGSRAKEQ